MESLPPSFVSLRHAGEISTQPVLPRVVAVQHGAAAELGACSFSVRAGSSHFDFDGRHAAGVEPWVRGLANSDVLCLNTVAHGLQDLRREGFS